MADVQSTLSFRLVSDRDLDRLLPLIAAFYAEDQYRFDQTILRSVMLQLVQDPSLGRAWFICLNDDEVGYVVLTFGYSLEYRGRDAFIDELFIRKGDRNQGIGTTAVQFVKNACCDLGVQALHLEVERDNTLAQRFYRKLGFEDHDRYLLTQQIFPGSTASPIR